MDITATRFLSHGPSTHGPTTRAHRWYVLGIEILFLALFGLLSPIYYLNRWDFVRGKRCSPFYASCLVRLEHRYPLLYELAAFVENFPLWDRVYDILPDFSGDVLQVGCGTGLLNRYLRARKDIRFTNLDANLEALRVGRYLKRLKTCVHASIDKGTSLPDEAFDVVLFSRSFHHIHYHKRALKECARVLRRGGTVLIADPVILHEKSRLGPPQGYMANSSIDGVIWRFTPETFVRHLEACLPRDLAIQSVRCTRQLHVSNYNVFVPQTDLVAVLVKGSHHHAGKDPPAAGPG